MSVGGRWTQQRGCEDCREQETSHALHAEAGRRPILPPGRVISGVEMGEVRVRGNSPSPRLRFLSMEM